MLHSYTSNLPTRIFNIIAGFKDGAGADDEATDFDDGDGYFTANFGSEHEPPMEPLISAGLWSCLGNAANPSSAIKHALATTLQLLVGSTMLQISVVHRLATL